MNRIEVDLGFERFPIEHTCEGVNISPPLRIKGAQGVSMALIVDDPDCPTGTWVHWVIWNMPVLDLVPGNLPKQAEMERPFPARQGLNTGGEVGYDGPCPPRKHGPHRYFFHVYVLDRTLELGPRTTEKELRQAMEGHVLQSGQAVATYERR
ncbi:MAG TPA: YbhB/YbcL family Raf kinase inhibitor-like protein [Methanomassiliicoccales archaeon]|nr:YbhB/YbcL family Raf kinase inhibitor-like protein [Methanomassiliicoccales archaeon]